MTAGIIIVSDVYKYREVLYNLIAQELKVKYKGTFLGYFWSLLNPIFQLTVLAAVFSQLVKLGMQNYALFLFSGLLAWNFFMSALVTSARSLLDNENFIKKIYLPKSLFPLARVSLRGVDFLFSLVALTLLGLALGYPFHASYALVPTAILLLFFFTLGLSITVAVATVYFRDVQYLLNVFLQMLYFATPVLYPVQALPEKYHVFLKMNPVYTQVNLFQQLIYYGTYPSGQEWAIAALVSVSSMAIGFFVLYKFEDDLVFRM